MTKEEQQEDNSIVDLILRDKDYTKTSTIYINHHDRHSPWTSIF